MTPALDLRYVQLNPSNAARWRPELSLQEQVELARLIDRHQQVSWLAARWLVKRLLFERMGVADRCWFDPAEISVLSLDAEGRAVRPTILIRQQRLQLDLSISRTPLGVLVALSRREGLSLGVDLAVPSGNLIGDLNRWYTVRERQWIQQQPTADAAAQLWAIKQAYYKATNRGGVFSPRRLEVQLNDQGRFQCSEAGRSHDPRAYIAVTHCDGQVAALVVISTDLGVSDVSATYDSIIPQSQIEEIERQ